MSRRNWSNLLLPAAGTLVAAGCCSGRLWAAGAGLLAGYLAMSAMRIRKRML